MSDLPVARPTLTPEEIERNYNNRALVPTYPEYLDRYTAVSAATRASRPYTTHRFGAQPNSTFDLFGAANARALLVFIHGGYWRALTKEEFSFVAPGYCDKRVAVAVLNYDLCPNTTIGGIIDQIVAAMHYLARMPSVLKHWLVAGHSAGGHLTAAMWSPLAKLSPEVRTRIVGGMSISGIHDLDPMVDFSINSDLLLTKSEAHRLSPIAYAPRVEAPLIVTAGGKESAEFKRQANALYSAWPGVCQLSKAGVHFPPSDNHFSIVENFANPAGELFERMISLIPAAHS
jgi:arylformamidase